MPAHVKYARSEQHSTEAKRRIGERLVTAAMFFLLFLSLFKDDQATIATSDLFSTLTINPYVSFLKNNSNVALGLFFLSAIFSLLAISRFKFAIFPRLYLFVLASSIAAIRSQAENVDSSYKTFTSCILLFLLVIYCSATIAGLGVKSYRDALNRALLYAATCLICTNLFNYATGFGYITGNPRLFGTAAHPNFLGAQLAVSCIIVLAQFVATPRFYAKVAFLGVLIGGLFLLKETGSRTSVMMVAVGAFCYTWARANFALTRFFALALICTVIASVLLANGLDWTYGSSFDRGFGSGDTRSAAVSEMLDRISDEPVWGYGYFPGASENSYLRGWVAYGILYEFIFLALVGRLLAAAVTAARRQRDGSVYLFFALTFSLAAGGVLEGYLVDNFSYELLIWFLSCTGCLLGAGNFRSPLRSLNTAFSAEKS